VAFKAIVGYEYLFPIWRGYNRLLGLEVMPRASEIKAIPLSWSWLLELNSQKVFSQLSLWVNRGSQWMGGLIRVVGPNSLRFWGPFLFCGGGVFQRVTIRPFFRESNGGYCSHIGPGGNTM